MDKIIIVDFSLLREEDFPFSDFSKEKIENCNNVISADGKLYINKNYKELAEIVVPIFNMLTRQSAKALKRFKDVNFRKYWQYDLTNFTDFIEQKLKEKNGEVEAAECLMYLLIPIELERRKIEKWYYEK